MNDSKISQEFNNSNNFSETQDTSIDDAIEEEQDSEYETKELTYEMDDELDMGDTVRLQHTNLREAKLWMKHAPAHPEASQSMQSQFNDAGLSVEENSQQAEQESEVMTAEQLQIMQEFEEVADENSELGKNQEQDLGY